MNGNSERPMAGREEPEAPGIGMEGSYRRWRWTIFLLTWFAYVGYYLTRKAFPVAKVGILADPAMAIDKSAMGMIDGVYGIAYAAGQFIWGIAGDRFGSRRIVFGGMLGSVVAAMVMGLSTHVILFGILFFIQGLCQSTGWPPLNKTMSYWFARRERGRVMGLWVTNYVIGGVAGSALAGYAAYLTGSWRSAFFASALTLLVIALLFRILHRERPVDIGLPPVEAVYGDDAVAAGAAAAAAGAGGQGGDAADQGTASSWATIATVLRNPMIIRMGLAYFLLKPTRYAILFWGPVMAYEKLGTGIGSSALIGTAFEVAGPISAIFAGYATDKWFQTRRIPVVVIGLAAMAIMLFFFPRLTELGGAWTMAAVFFIIGLLLHGPESLLSSVAAVDFGTSKGAGSAVGFVNGMGSVGQILGLALPGVVSVHYGWDVLFTVFGCTTVISVLMLIGKWNALPGGARPAGQGGAR
jgi:OPA family sugar phosphate sensor protein UhpC-like MFS transporter